MEQVPSWIYQSQLFALIAPILGLIVGGIPFLLLYKRLKRKYDSHTSTLISFSIVLTFLFVGSLVINDDPPYIHFALGGILMIIVYYRKRKGIENK